MNSSLQHFNSLYESSADPWQVDSSWFERRKADILLAMLPQERYAHAFEPACGIGMLTRLLAPRCDKILAADFSARAVDETRRRLAELDNASVQILDLPDEWPVAKFDLIVISEYAYYLDEKSLGLLIEKLRDARARADIICCSSVIDFDDRKISPADLSRRFEKALGPCNARYADDRFETQLWTSPKGMPLPANSSQVTGEAS